MANVIAKNVAEVLADVKELIHLCNFDDDLRIVKKMKEMVQEFISNNSQFECLDEGRNNGFIPENKAVKGELQTSF